MTRRMTLALSLSLLMLAASPRQPARAAAAPQAGAADDGVAFAVHATGDFEGRFDPCGCTVPLGGLPRRAGYAKALEASLGGRAPVLKLDAGHMFASPTAEGQVAVEDAAVKNEWVLKASEMIGLRAANVSPYDLSYLTRAMAADGYDARRAAHPMLDRLVSANVVPADATVRPFKPYVVEEVRGERLGAAPLRVGIIGVTEVPSSGPTVAGYKITDPLEALRKHSPELRAKCDLLVVLAYVDRGALGDVEGAARGVDVIIAAHGFPRSKVAGELQLPVFVTVTDEARDIAELRFYRGPASPAGRFSRVVRREIVLNDEAPDDPETARFVDEARKAYALPQPAP